MMNQSMFTPFSMRVATAYPGQPDIIHHIGGRAGGQDLPVDERRRLSAQRAPWRRVWLWLAGSTVGVAVLALPDTGPRVFSFSEAHGPSVVDVVGIAILVGAWLPIAALLWRERRALGRRGRLPAVIATAGVTLLVVSIAWDVGLAWVPAVALLVWAQVLVLRAVVSGSSAEL
jgi:hypothetical protein